jgi:hypothetical protein
LDSFDDRYLGTKSSDPTVDNDGNALAAGALYFSTTANVMKVYDGSSWIAATSAGATSLLRFRYVATSGQTTFTGADSATATLSYTVNNIAVHRNGVTLDTSEYTASNGTSIVLNVAAGTGDIIDIIAFKSFTVSDALSAITGGTVSGPVAITGVTTVQAGSASLPAITTTGDTNTGIFFPAADTIAFSEGGVEAARFDSSGNLGLGTTSPVGKLHVESSGTLQGLFRCTAGASYTSVRLYNDVNSSARALEIDYFGSTAGGGERAEITTTGSFPLCFLTNNTERVRVDTSGNLLVGNTATTSGARLVVKGSGTTGATYNIFTVNSAGNMVFATEDGGTVYTGMLTDSPYNKTTGSAANMFVSSANGALFRSTSSLKYKKNVQDTTHGLVDILKLRAVTYEGKSEADAGKTFGGLIAEEVHAAGLTEFVQYADDGTPDALAYGHMVSLCVKAIQEQQAIIETLTQRITALEGA